MALKEKPPMRKIGAIIAGGKATRFGSDKGAALLNGKPLIDHVAQGLAPQVEQIIIVGRHWHKMLQVHDYPKNNMGPLAGLCGALRYAEANRFDAVMTAGCDMLPVPKIKQIGIVQGHYLAGLWPSSFAAALAEHLIATADSTATNHQDSKINRSMRKWIAESHIPILQTTAPIFNINSQEDLKLYAERQAQHLLSAARSS